MPLQLNSETEKLHGGFINRTMVKEMVDYYRVNRRKSPDSLKFAHFTVIEIIELLVDNGIIGQPPLSTAQQTDLEKFGIKVYIANHAKKAATCPSNRQTTYLDKDTVIICNTKLEDNTFKDMLDDKQWVSFAGAGTSKGIDKGGICPPDCPTFLDPEGHDSEDVSTES